MSAVNGIAATVVAIVDLVLVVIRRLVLIVAISTLARKVHVFRAKRE